MPSNIDLRTWCAYALYSTTVAFFFYWGWKFALVIDSLV